MAQTLEERLKKIERGDAELLKLFPSLVKASGNAMYTSDFMIIGAIKRTLSLSQGFRTHIRDRNFICAGTLMRAMLDTALRINALGLVRDPEALAGAVMRGGRLDKLKDRDNQRLSDAYANLTIATSMISSRPVSSPVVSTSRMMPIRSPGKAAAGARGTSRRRTL